MTLPSLSRAVLLAAPLLLGLGGIAAAPSPAAAQSAAQQAQQQRMRDCNAEARRRSLSGEPRKSFMKTCLSRRGGVGGAPGTESPAGN
jgi:hypothetical protein